MQVLGIDIGTSEIKGSVIDTRTGKAVSEVKKIDGFKSSSPHKIVASIHRLASKQFEWKGPIGCAIPESVRSGTTLSASRLDPAWDTIDAEHLISEITGTQVTVINDADASGIAEVKFGAGRHDKGVIIMLTVGTGIGSAVFVDRKLVPNTELGLLEIRGITAQDRASNTSRKAEGLGRKAWAKRLEFVLEAFEEVFHPDLFIIGGQMSRKSEKILPHIKIKTPLRGASFENDAAMVGAAVVAAERKKGEKVFYI